MTQTTLLPGASSPLAQTLIRALSQGADRFTSVGVAVSGGSDSMALLRLAAEVAPELGWRLEAATIDHRLRPEAADEACFVAQTCTALGLRHETFVWQDHPDQGNVMALGSSARYERLAQWAQNRGLDAVLIAHTADDQLETFVMGLGRGSGLDGLTGMRPAWRQAGALFLRPLLEVSRQALRAYLQQIGQVWVDDPSNENPAYTRARLRAKLPLLEQLELQPARLLQTIRTLAQSQTALQRLTASLFAEIAQEAAGALIFQAEAFVQADPELRRRLISAATRWISSQRHPPRAESLAALEAQLVSGQGGTLGGGRWRVSGQTLRLTREPRACQGAVLMDLSKGPQTALWDGRWQVTYSGPPKNGLKVTLGALGEQGYQVIQSRPSDVPRYDQKNIKRDALLVSPVIWQEDKLIYAPLGAYLAKDWGLEMSTSFQKFILTH